MQEENGNLFMNTGSRIDVSYNEATDILTFSPGGDYIRSCLLYTSRCVSETGAWAAGK